MNDPMKRAVGKWWRRWVRPATGRRTTDEEIVGKDLEDGERGDWFPGSAQSGSSARDIGDKADEEMEVERGNEEGSDGNGDDVGEKVAGLMEGFVMEPGRLG